MNTTLVTVVGASILLCCGCVSSDKARQQAELQVPASTQAGGPVTYEQAVSAEAMRLMKLDTTLSYKDAYKMAGTHVKKELYPAAASVVVSPGRQERQKAAQKKFEQDLAKTLKD